MATLMYRVWLVGDETAFGRDVAEESARQQSHEYGAINERFAAMIHADRHKFTGRATFPITLHVRNLANNKVFEVAVERKVIYEHKPGPSKEIE